MNSLADIFSRQNSQSQVMRAAAAALTVESANKILADLFGPEIQKYAQAVCVKNEILSVDCRGSSAAMEIKMNESKILAKIKEEFPRSTVARVRCRI